MDSPATTIDAIIISLMADPDPDVVQWAAALRDHPPAPSGDE